MIKRFNQFIKEELTDTPEAYVTEALMKLKKRIEKMFGSKEGEEIKKMSDKEKDKASFEDLGLELNSIELANSPKLYDSLTVKFSDTESWYSLYITIDLKDALPKDEEFNDEDIEKCYIKFKKYSMDDVELESTITKTVKPSDIDEDFLVQLKLDLDKEEGGDEEGLEFELED